MALGKREMRELAAFCANAWARPAVQRDSAVSVYVEASERVSIFLLRYWDTVILDTLRC